MSKILRYAGFATEAQFAEDPAPAAAFHVDMASASLDAPNDPHIDYEGGLGRGARTHRPGFYSPSGNVVYAFDIVTIGWLLKWALKDYAFTADGGGVGVNTHELWAGDDRLLDSFCTRLGKDVFEHVFSGCVINQLQIQVEGDLVQATADIVAAKDAKAALQAKADLLLPSGYPLAFHEVTGQIAAGDVSALVKSLSLTINNSAAADEGRGIGSRHPYRIPVAGREITYDLSLWYGDTDQLERFWGDASAPAVGGATEFPLQLDFDAGDDGAMTIELPRTRYTQVQQQPSGRSEIVQSGTGKAYTDTVTLADASTHESELLVSIDNAQETMA